MTDLAACLCDLLEAFRVQRENARRRGIPFKLTFEQWLAIWLDSNYLDERGRGMDRYCMARFGDQGAYETGNVHVITNQENSADIVATPESRAAKSRALKGKPKSETHRAAQCVAALKRAPRSEATRLKMSRSAKLRALRLPMSKEHMENMRARKEQH
jgi:hypothetical protein